MNNFTRLLIPASVLLMLSFSVRSQNVVKTANVGIGTLNPAQKLEIAGNNTIRIDGLVGATYNVAPSASTSSFVYVNSLGDLYSMPFGTSGNVLFINSSGIPTWASPSAATNAWSLTGNTISPFAYGTNFIGTSNASGAPLEFVVNNAYAGVIDAANSNVFFGALSGNDATSLIASTFNVGIGWSALATLASGNTANTAVGYNALLNYHNSNATAVGAYALYNNTTGTPNTALGYGASYNVTTGTNNDAMGYLANYWNTTGTFNVAMGDSALFGATTVAGAGAVYAGANYNVGVGVSALAGLATITTAPLYNTAVGYEASRHNTNGQANTSVGYQANYTNTTSFGNVAVGLGALYSNTQSGNTAVGTNALYYNNVGGSASGPNTAIGDSAMYLNSTGVKNVAVGYGALTAAGQSGTNTNNLNTAVGFLSMSSGTTTASSPMVGNTNIGAYTGASYQLESYNVAVGAYALSSGAATSNPQSNVAIGAYAMYAAGAANYNVAIGSGSGGTPATGTLSAITTGAGNLAIGYESGVFTGGSTFNLTSGSYNVYLGYQTYGATIQNQNVAVGFTAHAANTTGIANSNSNDVAVGSAAIAYGAGVTGATAIGASASATNANTTAIGSSSSAAGSGSTAIGPSANTSTFTNSTAIGPSASAGANNVIALGNSANVNGASQTNVGIGTNTPSRELEVAGTTNTIRVGGLASGGTFNANLSGSVGNVVYSNTSNGDLYSLPNGATGTVLTVGATGVPTWAATSAIPTASLPLVVSSGTLTLPGATGTILVGTGTASQFLPAGPVNDILIGGGTGANPQWVSSSYFTGLGDNWGSQVAVTDSNVEYPTENTITGDGLSTSPLRLAQQNASNNQTLLWSTASNTWKPGNVNTALTTNAIGGGTAVIISNGLSQVVGGSNVTIDVQGTAGGILYGKGAGSSALFTAAGTSGQILTSTGAGAPTWTSVPAATGWALTGNSNTTPGTNYIGTTNDEGFDIEVNGANAGAIDPLNTTNSAGNVYLGAASTSAPILNGAGDNDRGDNNVGLGLSALASAGGPAFVGGTPSVTSGYISGNVAVGVYSLSSAVYGGANTALGAWSQRLFNYPTANTPTGNTSAGAYSLYSNSQGLYNTSVGYYSMYGSGSSTALGNGNTALGYQALYTTGAGMASNAAIGSKSLFSNTGSRNTGVGDSTLYSNTSGTNNTAVGYGANVLSGNLTNATAVGAYAVVAQSNSMVLGQISGVGLGTANTNVGIGTNTPDADAALAVKTLHLETQQNSAPGVTPSGGVTSAVATGTDVAGNVVFTVPGSGSVGTQVTVNFITPYTTPPTVIITPASQATGQIMGTYKPYVVTSSGNNFTVNFAVAPSSSQSLMFNYFVIEAQ